MDIAIILTEKYSGSEWTLDGNDYEGLTWLSESDKPSKSELELLWAEVELAIESRADKRASALAKLAALGLTEEEIAAL